MSNDVYTLAEHLQGQLTGPTFELLGTGRQLANDLGGNLVAVLPGHNVRPLADQMGVADRVLYVDDPALAGFTPEAYQRVLAALVQEHDPKMVLLLNTALGMDVAAGLSAALDWPLVAYCNGLAVEDGQVIATSQIYGGKVLAESEFDTDHGIVSVLAGAFPAEAGQSDGPANVEERSSPVPLAGLRTRFKRLIEPETADVDITQAEKLVSVGRGIQSADNLELVQELADALGAALSASRPITDNGWLPRNRQVGKSGLTVKPKLYLAVGISGAPEHLEGMKDAELIIAINTDQNAPIFEVAHYGVTADLFDVVPALTEAIEGR